MPPVPDQERITVTVPHSSLILECDMSSVSLRLILLTLFAIAMAHVEAALVVHLRSLYYPGDPLSIFPPAILSERDLNIELAREAATLVMLFTVALLAAQGPTRVFAAFVYSFGMWDVFYYVWLKAMIDWPQNWLEWDVLFLIPWPWFGPWIAPVLIALMFVAWGAWILSRPGRHRFTAVSLALFSVGVLLTLASFLSPAVPLLSGGAEAFRSFLPQSFPWALFGSGYLLMLLGLWRVAATTSER